MHTSQGGGGRISYDGKNANLDRYEKRRGDLAHFMKALKLRASFYMNKRLGRVGTLWEGRSGRDATRAC